MACVIQLSDLVVVEEVGVGDVDDGDCNRCRISIPVETQDAIPTFDASDVDKRLEEEEQGRLVIGEMHSLVKAALEFVWAALVEAHSQEIIPEPSDRQWADVVTQLKTQADAIERLSRKEIQGWDLESQAPDLSDPVRGLEDGVIPDRSVLIVRKLAPAIQLAFRRSVLQPFAVYVVTVIVIVVTSLHCVAIKTSPHEYLEESSLPSTVATASGILVCVCLGVLYAHRFQAPSNVAAFTLLTLSEIVFAVAVGVAFDPYAVIVPSLLFGGGVLVLSGLACRSSFDNNMAKPPCLTTALIVAIATLATVTVLADELLGAHVTHTTTPLLVVSLGLGSLGMAWIALVLNVIENTMAPDAHATAILFFQADIVVVVVLIPTRLALQLWHSLAGSAWLPTVTQSKSQRWRKTNPVNHVAPAFWPDDTTPLASLKTSVPAPPTPLYPLRWIPCQHRVDDSVLSDTSDAVTALEPNINVHFEPKTLDRAGTPRRRSSISS